MGRGVGGGGEGAGVLGLVHSRMDRLWRFLLMHVIDWLPARGEGGGREVRERAGPLWGSPSQCGIFAASQTIPSSCQLTCHSTLSSHAKAFHCTSLNYSVTQRPGVTPSSA